MDQKAVKSSLPFGAYLAPVLWMIHREVKFVRSGGAESSRAFRTRHFSMSPHMGVYRVLTISGLRALSANILPAAVTSVSVRLCRRRCRGAALGIVIIGSFWSLLISETMHSPPHS